VYRSRQEYIGKMTYRNLKRAWIGLKKARDEGDYKMKYHAIDIQMFERKLHLPVSNLSVVKEVQDNTKQKEESGTGIHEL
jgi:hypothetical protein